MPDEGSPADQELLRRHVAGDAEAFGELFRRHRDRLWAVALRTVCDPEEAAVILDTSPGTVKSRCARARARLLPHLVHLQGNRSASESVSPAQGGDTP